MLNTVVVDNIIVVTKKKFKYIWASSIIMYSNHAAFIRDRVCGITMSVVIFLALVLHGPI